MNRVLVGAVGGMPRAFWFLWAGTLINRLGSFVGPFLAIYLTQQRGVSVAVAGLIVSAYGAGSVIANTIGGMLADRVGRRATLLLGLVLGAGSMLLLGLAREVWAVAAATFILGLTGDLYRPAVMAMVADVVPAPDRLRAFTLLYWAINLGFAVAALVVGAISSINYLWLFVGDALTTLAFAGLIFLKVPESMAGAPPAKDRLPGNVWTPFRDPVFLPFLLLNLVVAIIFQQFSVTLPIEMAHRGFTVQDFARVMAVNGLLIVLFQPFMARVLRPLPRGAVLAVASTLTGIGFGINAVASHLSIYALSVAVWTAGEIIMAPVNSTIVADLSPAHLRGRYQGAFNLAFAASVLLGPALGAGALDALHQEGTWIWVGCAVAGTAAGLAHLALAGPRRKRLEGLASGWQRE